MVRLSKAELGWLGGIIDGEGCLSIQRRNKGTQINQITLRILNTDIEIITKSIYILTQILGHEPNVFYTINQPPRKGKYAIAVCKKNELLLVLKTLDPYLFAKRLEKRKAIIDFLETKESKGRGRGTREYTSLEGQVLLNL